MRENSNSSSTFVIKPDELAALNYLSPDHPHPQRIQWINRGTDQELKPSTVAMLLRTLYLDIASPSVVRLHRSAGLRVVFRNERDRERFARAFAAARDQVNSTQRHLVTAVFDGRMQADRAVAELKEAGIPEQSISLLWRANQFLDPQTDFPEGHSKLSVVGATAGGGVAGAIFGIAVLAVPGVGPMAAAGAIAASVIPSVAATSGILGATGGAIARMLTDHDVDGVSATYYQQQIQRGKIFVSVDTRIAKGQRDTARLIMRQCGGRAPRSA